MDLHYFGKPDLDRHEGKKSGGCGGSPIEPCRGSHPRAVEAHRNLEAHSGAVDGLQASVVESCHYN
jgi:hypothetical protein